MDIGMNFSRSGIASVLGPGGLGQAEMKWDEMGKRTECICY